MHPSFSQNVVHSKMVECADEHITSVQSWLVSSPPGAHFLLRLLHFSSIEVFSHPSLAIN